MKKRTKLEQGFTLIELMIVIAILAILMSIAVPAYQDYSIRAEVSEGVHLAATPKLAVSEAYNSSSQLPDSNAAAGYSFTATSRVSDITIGAGGTVTITFNSSVPPPIRNQTIVYTPDVGTVGSVQWDCRQGTLEASYRPSECR